MAIVTTVLICATVFGVAVAISAFVRQLLLSRENRLNDLAQTRALDKETEQLTVLRQTMKSNPRSDMHYRLLENNSDSIRYIDKQIDQVIDKKMELIQRYSSIIKQQSTSIIKGDFNAEKKHDCDTLRQEIDKEIAKYDAQIAELQQTRAKLWGNHQELQDKIIGQENEHNKQLNDIYKQHSSIIEKLSLRHSESRELVTTKTIDEGSSAFKLMVLAPIKFLLAFFTKSDSIDLDKVMDEIKDREDVKDTQDSLDDWEELDDEEDLDEEDYNDLKIMA